MNHRWKADVCIKCGLRRELKEYQKVIRTYSALGHDGCFYDRPIYQWVKEYYYTHPDYCNGTLNKPDCIPYRV